MNGNFGRDFTLSNNDFHRGRIICEETEEGSPSPLLSPELTSCFSCLNLLIFSANPVFHSGWSSQKVHPHHSVRLGLWLHFSSSSFPASLQLSTILSHAWRKHPGFLEGISKCRGKPKLCPHSLHRSIKLKLRGSGDWALKQQSCLQGYLGCLYQITSPLLSQIFLVQLSFSWAVSETASIFLADVCFNSLITEMKNTRFYKKNQSNLRKWVPRQFLRHVRWFYWATKCYFRPA